MIKKYRLKKEVKNILNKTLLTILIFLIGMILIKENPKLKTNIKKIFYEDNIKFINYKNLYEKYFGNILSSKKIKKEESVSSEKLIFKNKTKFNEGVLLQVNNNYSVPSIESGIVVFIGTKENLKNTIVVEGIDGVNTYYSSIINSNYKLYDYIDKGEVIGQVEKDKLYLKFQKDGKYLNYQKFI